MGSVFAGQASAFPAGRFLNARLLGTVRRPFPPFPSPFPPLPSPIHGPVMPREAAARTGSGGPFVCFFRAPAAHTHYRLELELRGGAGGLLEAQLPPQSRAPLPLILWEPRNRDPMSLVAEFQEPPHLSTSWSRQPTSLPGSMALLMGQWILALPMKIESVLGPGLVQVTRTYEYNVHRRPVDWAGARGICCKAGFPLFGPLRLRLLR